MKLLLKEGRLYLLILGLMTVILYFVHPLLVMFSIAVFGFLVFFFRDPARQVPVAKPAETSFLSPADGKVMVIDLVDDNFLFQGKSKVVTIFLSPLDVHVNRMPIDGVIETVEYRKGQFRPAYIADAPSVNERNYVVVRGEHTQCLVVQIVGVLARRVVCWVSMGDRVRRGEKFGLMKFGSCIQVYMPPDTEITVREGARVTGAETVIGVIPHGFMG